MKKIIAVDLDGTLCEEMTDWRNYDRAVPIQENIEKVRRLKSEGNTIVIDTARFTEDREVTIKWLKRYDVPFDKVHFEKLRADLYIDQRAKRMEEI